MKALVIQNASDSGLGVVEEILLENHGIVSEILNATEIKNLADIDVSGHDLVILLGSGRSVYETDLDWIASEKQFTKKLIDTNKPTWGICFGAQMIASALDARVAPLGKMTRGWIANDKINDDIWRGPWFRWHGDIFDLPVGATLLASEGGVVQGIQIGSTVATQFHPEVDAEIISGWYSHFLENDKNDEAQNIRKADLLKELPSSRKRTEALVADILERCLNGKKTQYM